MRFPALLALLTTALVAMSGCRSSEKKAPVEAAVGNEATPDGADAPHALTGVADRCATKPAPQVCCEALIPSCNECRERNQREAEEWQKNCGSEPSVADNGCETPPVVGCCSDDTDECRTCRSTALNQILAWKAKCAASDKPLCDRPPVPTACCDALTPSCDACRSRNERVQHEWQERCK